MAIIGALIISAGALLGIWLGAVYAAGRLEAQMDEQRRWFNERREEDAKRLGRQLKEESDRLDRRLDHDRRMRDRDALRNMLDEGAILVNDAMDRVYGLTAQSVSPLEAGESKSEREALRKQTAKEIRERIDALTRFLLRLLVRFPRGHPLVLDFAAIKDVVFASYETFYVRLDEVTEMRKTQGEKLTERFTAVHKHLLQECRTELGVPVQVGPAD